LAALVFITVEKLGTHTQSQRDELAEIKLGKRLKGEELFVNERGFLFNFSSLNRKPNFVKSK